MHLINVLHIIGGILRFFGLTFLAPIAVCTVYGEWTDIAGFVIAAAISVVAGQVLLYLTRTAEDSLRQIEALSVVAGAWLLLAFLGAVPYIWTGFGLIDSLFESMSGITATGATIITDFERPGHGLLFWRALTQWLGGLGVIALVVAVFPRFSVGVRRLFAAEAAGPKEEQLAPQIRQTAAYLWRLYAGLTVTACLALFLVGMPLDGAICHALTLMAAGGFSPHGQSIMGYGNPALEWIVCVFMFLAGANFALQYRALLGKPGVLFQDDEMKAYVGIIVLGIFSLVGLLWVFDGVAGSVRVATFQVLSILTTTGYASADFNLWSDQAKVVLLSLMFIGGCAGSAAGGAKVLRHVLIGRFTLTELRRTLHPRGLLPVKLNGKVVADDVIRGVLVFFLFYILTFALCAAVVIGFGADLETGITASIAALGNVGPGFGDVGPMSSYGSLHGVSKLALIAAMWIGRLEVLTVLTILQPEVWRHVHWSTFVPSRRR